MQGTRFLSLLLLSLLLVSLWGTGCAQGTAAEYVEETIHIGTPAIDAGVNVREKPSAEAKRVAQLSPGESCIVTGKSGDWYSVEVEGTLGYVRKDLLTLRKETILVEKIVEDPLSASVEGFSVPFMEEPGDHFRVSGTVHSNIPLVEVRLTIHNLRTLKDEAVISHKATREQNTLSFDLAAFSDAPALRRLVSGEKEARLTVCSANEEALIAAKAVYISGKCADPKSATSACQISVSRGSAKAFLDDSYGTSWQPRSSSDTVTVTIPAKLDAESIALEWDKAPHKLLLTCYDADGAELLSLQEKNPGKKLNLYYDLPEGTRQVVLRSGDKDNGLNKLRIYQRGQVPVMVQHWQDAPEKVDMLLIVPHMNDETLYFSGVLSQLTAQGKSVLVVYMTTDDRNKHAEALDCLWTHGVRIHPVFVGFKDYKVDTYSQAERLWGTENTLKAITSLLRRYQPEVVLTQDVNGEYGHQQHIMTSRYVIKGVEAAADSAVYPESGAAWQVKKLYVHLGDAEKKLELHFDTPMEELGGLSPMQVAFRAFDKHYSQLKFPTYSLLVDGRDYDCTFFSLYRSTVGEDVLRNSFFENID